MKISEFWRNAPKYSLLEAAYLVCGLEPQGPKETAPAKVISACRQMKECVVKTAPQYIGEHPHLIPVPLEFVREFADYFGESDFFKPECAQIDKPLTESDRAKLLTHIGLLALVVAEKKGKYQKAGKPVISTIADAVQLITDAFEFPGAKATGKTEISKTIKAGLKLLLDDD